MMGYLEPLQIQTPKQWRMRKTDDQNAYYRMGKQSILNDQ